MTLTQELAQALRAYLHLDWTLSEQQIGMKPLNNPLREATKNARAALAKYDAEKVSQSAADAPVVYMVEKQLGGEWTPVEIAKISDFPNAVYRSTLEPYERIRRYSRYDANLSNESSGISGQLEPPTSRGSEGEATAEAWRQAVDDANHYFSDCVVSAACDWIEARARAISSGNV